MYELLRILEEHARYSDERIAAMLGRTEQEVREEREGYEKQDIVRGYKAIVDWEQTGRDFVSARIEMKVTPKRDRGFEELAEQIARFDEVQSLYLMSGGYDLALTVVGKSFKDIASFVAYRLAPLDSVQSTSTHFVLRKYKEKGVRLIGEKQDGRVGF